MRKLTLAAAAVVVVSGAAIFAPTQKAQAMVIYPWCAHYASARGSDGGTNCGFISYAQCMAAVSGMMGFCDANPWWEGPVPQAAARPQVRPPRG